MKTILSEVEITPLCPSCKIKSKQAIQTEYGLIYSGENIKLITVLSDEDKILEQAWKCDTCKCFFGYRENTLVYKTSLEQISKYI